jgi:flagellar biosynthesis GTPase FlhF
MAPPLLVSFVSEILRYDPVRRLTAQQALSHPFLTLEPDIKKTFKSMVSLQEHRKKSEDIKNKEKAKSTKNQGQETWRTESNHSTKRVMPRSSSKIEEEDESKRNRSLKNAGSLGDLTGKPQEPVSVFRQHFNSGKKKDKKKSHGPDTKEGEKEKESNNTLPSLSRHFNSGIENISKAYLRSSMSQKEPFANRERDKLPLIKNHSTPFQRKEHDENLLQMDSRGQKSLLLNIKEYS